MGVISTQHPFKACVHSSVHKAKLKGAGMNSIPEIVIWLFLFKNVSVIIKSWNITVTKWCDPGDTIQAEYTYIVKENGGIAMAQLANLPSRLFYILFGQSPEVKKHKKDRKKRLKGSRPLLSQSLEPEWMHTAMAV